MNILNNLIIKDYCKLMIDIKSFIHNKFIKSLQSYKNILDSTCLIVAVSGGQDSMCLIKLLKDYKKLYKWNIKIINFNHNWRQDSYLNSKAINNISLRWGFQFIYFTKYIQNETAARKWRYNKLVQLAKDLDINYILTAHTATDKIETSIYNFIRGSGFEGITSLNYYQKINTKINIIRPLVYTTRDETIWFCRKFYMPIWSDITNYSYNIKRNRIRQELIPYISKYFNNKFNKNFTHFLNIINKEVEYLQNKSNYFYNISKHKKHTAINRILIGKLPLVLQRRIIRIFIYKKTKNKLNLMKTDYIIDKYTATFHKEYYRTEIDRNWFLVKRLNWIYLVNKIN
uniref:tRNA(Ile)-lysidine synthase, chloroplastic n=1 Tax=Compsopogon caeruleus TaxID=31354 RepID=A0A1Z1XBB3_9RHOD|nr:hypothetical protein [Compsopogon caeruleus]ARX96152.1 hypothetical protein [Compsopogon caeruleus]